MKSGLLPRIVALALAFLCAPSPLSFSQSAALSTPEEVTRLKGDNEKLRAENQRLRQLLIQGLGAPAPARASPQSASPTASASTDAQTLTHWLTTSSGKRHNQSCKNFQVTKGRSCTATEGTPCKTCGG